MELWDVYTKTRELTGRTHVRGSEPPLAHGDYHIVIDVWTFLPDGRLILSQRDPAKPHGLKWESTGGSITTGESSLIGAAREVEEELGLVLNPNEMVLLGEQIRNDSLIDVYVTRLPKVIRLDELTYQVGEVVDARIVTKEEFLEMGSQGLLTHNMLPRYELYQEVLDTYFEPVAVLETK
ncbi:NUDIX domain-containing protein [Chryseomicrobium sp. FSL W7-1435]|uniref:NUDIX hydrolase n=1 Tax=Chryseomicrobium sp. FSL W7-1435 TaxID=2921704 RepID=UPI00315ACF6C